LRIFQSYFIKKCINSNIVSKRWIDKGIKTSCNRKRERERELYLKVRDNNEMEHKLYCKQYCKILSKVIKGAKKLYYKETITKLKSKMKTTCNIIHKEIANCANVNNIKSLRINNHTVHNQISIANAFNNYFSNIVESTGIKRINEKAKDSCPLQYLFKYFKQLFKDINWP
jgi:hypothetical protein